MCVCLGFVCHEGDEGVCVCVCVCVCVLLQPVSLINYTCSLSHTHTYVYNIILNYFICLYLSILYCISIGHMCSLDDSTSG